MKTVAETEDKDEEFDLKAAIRNSTFVAMKGGISGAAAMSVQVLTLMWLRTTINYQYRYGASTMQALRQLFNEGGVRRFYRGLLPSLIQGPLCRFGDIFANDGVLHLLQQHENTRDLPMTAKTLASSVVAAGWRTCIMPVDTMKTILQVQGKDGLSKLRMKMKARGPSVLFHGSLAASTATFVAYYPWFASFNYLDSVLPAADTRIQRLYRYASIGFVSSVISDVTSNSIRVVKTVRQTSETTISYAQSMRGVIERDGLFGLFSRGLKTKIIAHGFQSMVFTVIWKYIQPQ